MTKVLVLIPIKPTMHPGLKARVTEIANRMAADNPALDLHTHIDPTPEPGLPGDERPWSKVARVRNKLLDSVPWLDFDYLLWLDADVVDAPPRMATQLVEVAGGGVAAPLVLVEGGDRFYDWAAFVEAGTDTIQPENRWHVPSRNLSHEPPYWLRQPASDVVPMDCVGTVYVVHTDVYRTGVRHEDHPAFTDHHPICRRAREMGRPVVCDRRLRAYHANLPAWGEQWH